LQVKQDGFFPADLLFLASTNTDGVCYIEVYYLYFFGSGSFFSMLFKQNFTSINIGFEWQTANLDGETNLKIRKALEKTWDYVTPDKASEFKGLHFFLLLYLHIIIVYSSCNVYLFWLTVISYFCISAFGCLSSRKHDDNISGIFF